MEGLKTPIYWKTVIAWFRREASADLFSNRQYGTPGTLWAYRLQLIPSRTVELKLYGQKINTDNFAIIIVPHV